MKKVLLSALFLSICGLLVLGSQGTVKAATDTVNLQVSVAEYLSFSITAGDAVDFSTLSPGTPVPGPAAGTVCSVTTNSANGYTIALSDSVAGSDSALVHTDATTRIADYGGTIATPTLWTGTGLGITLFAADTTKAVKWGTGTTYDDANNKYAGIPQNATVAHTVTGFVSGTDTSSWAFQIDAPNDQKTGDYSGSVTFTATAVLS
jgi:hypothetical protein